MQGLCLFSQSFPRLQARPRIIKGCGSPRPQGLVPSSPSKVSPARWQLDATRGGKKRRDRQCRGSSHTKYNPSVVQKADGFLCQSCTLLSTKPSPGRIFSEGRHLWSSAVHVPQRPSLHKAHPSTAHCQSLHDVSAENLRFPFPIHDTCFLKKLECMGMG